MYLGTVPSAPTIIGITITLMLLFFQLAHKMFIFPFSYFPYGPLE